MDSDARILAKRYARAYMALDGKAHTAALEDAARGRIAGLKKVLDASKPHMKALTHPAVNGPVKLEVLHKILGSSDTGPAEAFAALLVRQGRFGLIGEITGECQRLSDIFCGVTRAEVFSRYPLSEGEVKRITSLLSGPSGRKIVLKQEISEKVLGGFEIKIGDIVIDASVRGRLEALRAGLLK